ncbi:hypothetical protein GCK32_006077 [Trichostrongylus colubriformis]|uniref:ShKT domain-containing protein n=1 Tax=Trichostrongylus colubriformis TaxID=6319 RepID=A0AAN8IIC9_TRICO
MPSLSLSSYHPYGTHERERELHCHLRRRNEFGGIHFSEIRIIDRYQLGSLTTKVPYNSAKHLQVRNRNRVNTKSKKCFLRAIPAVNDDLAMVGSVHDEIKTVQGNCTSSLWKQLLPRPRWRCTCPSEKHKYIQTTPHVCQSQLYMFFYIVCALFLLNAFTAEAAVDRCQDTPGMEDVCWEISGKGKCKTFKSLAETGCRKSCKMCQ